MGQYRTDAVVQHLIKALADSKLSVNRSALASLWFVNDESTAELSARFYQALVGGGQNRAAALRTAQQAMIADERFSHPAYWAPFLMIGSWL